MVATYEWARSDDHVKEGTSMPCEQQMISCQVQASCRQGQAQEVNSQGMGVERVRGKDIPRT